MYEPIRWVVGEVDIRSWSQHQMHFLLCVEQWDVQTAVVVDAFVRP